MKKALITGITGQDGSFLTDLLIAKGYKVYGIIRRSSSFNTGRLDRHYSDWHHNPDSTLKLFYGDLTDDGSIRHILHETQPDEIYHLAAQSHVKVSFDLPIYTVDTIALGTLRLLEVTKEVCPKAKIYNACSSEQFGSSLPPQNELTQFKPCSPYGAAKTLAYEMARIYRESYGLFISNGILFNHESHRRLETFVTRKITRTITRIYSGLQNVLYLGNLYSKRDWGYAGDYVDAMWLMLQQDKPDDFVIATGETHTIKEFCEEAVKFYEGTITWEGNGEKEVGHLDNGGEIRILNAYYRPFEVDVLCGDASKAKNKLGWTPKHYFKDLVKLMMTEDDILARKELNAIRR